MPNTLTTVIPQILAQGLLELRNQAVMPRLVNTDYSRSGADKGDTIDVNTPASITSASVSPSNTAPTTTDITPTKTQIVLDQWIEAAFYMTDKDISDAMEGFVPLQVTSAITSLAEHTNSAILALYDQVYGVVGVAGTTPFASNYNVATAARKLLNEQKAHMQPRRMVLDPDAEEKAINLTAFADSGFTSESGVILDGHVGRKLGMEWAMDQQVKTHTAGTLSDTTDMSCLVNSASVAIGDLTVATNETSLTGTVVVGDVFTVAGDTQQYVITAGATASSNAVTLTFFPAAKVAWADNAQITFASIGPTNSVENLCFHRDAFALATRPLQAPGGGLGSLIASAVDPITGLALRLEVSREHKRTRWSFDILYGVKCVRPELAVRVWG